jgi:hypothetical protein
MSAFDDRIFKVEFTYSVKSVPTQLTLDGNLYIRASGMKYIDSTQNECTIQIANLKKETRDQLATQLTPWNYNQARKSVKLYAGRESTGLFLLYAGDIIECQASQPPNIMLTIKSKTMNWFKYNILGQAQNVAAPLSKIVDGIGLALGDPINGTMPVIFQATDKTIANWSFSGPAVKMLEKLSALGGIDVFVDDNTLIVKDRGKSLINVSHVLSMESGMVGVPQITEVGIQAKMMLAPSIKIGGQLSLVSLLNPLLNSPKNGGYSIYKLGFEIASRDTPFYGLVWGSQQPILMGASSGYQNL